MKATLRAIRVYSRNARGFPPTELRWARPRLRKLFASNLRKHVRRFQNKFFTCNVVVLERKRTELWEASECPASDALDPEILNLDFKVFFCIIAIMFWKSEPWGLQPCLILDFDLSPSAFYGIMYINGVEDQNKRIQDYLSKTRSSSHQSHWKSPR